MIRVFKLFKRNEEISAPVTGGLIPLSLVKDPVFSQGLVGAGFAVDPADGNVYSPISGIVKSIFPTKHAMTLVTDKNDEVLLHVGIDTVELKGEGFKVFVKEGDKVTPNDKLLNVDLKCLDDYGKGKSVMVLFPNLTELPIEISQNNVSHGDSLFMLQ